jgi:hypothetical protein
MSITRSLAYLALVATLGSAYGVCSAAPALAATSANAKVCRLMPTADVERVLGMKATKVSGTDSADVSICSAVFGGGTAATVTYAQVQYAKPGRPGLPPDVQTMLELPRKMKASGENVVVQQFGNVGCYSLTAQTRLSATCGDPSGYITMTVGRVGPMVPFDTVRKLLATAKSKI